MATTDFPSSAPDDQGARSFVPRGAIGWWMLLSVLAGLLPWVVLPMVTMAYRETYPITDTWVMPAIGAAITIAAAFFNIVGVWRWRERSVLNIIGLVVIGMVAIFVTLMLLGEGAAGV